MIDEKEIARLRALANAATPGPWEMRRYGCDICDASPCEHHDQCYVAFSYVDGCNNRNDSTSCESRDAAFIAAAREALPALLDEIERSRKAKLAAVAPCNHEPGATIFFTPCPGCGGSTDWSDID